MGFVALPAARILWVCTMTGGQELRGTTNREDEREVEHERGKNETTQGESSWQGGSQEAMEWDEEDTAHKG